MLKWPVLTYWLGSFCFCRKAALSSGRSSCCQVSTQVSEAVSQDSYVFGLRRSGDKGLLTLAKPWKQVQTAAHGLGTPTETLGLWRKMFSASCPDSDGPRELVSWVIRAEYRVKAFSTSSWTLTKIKTDPYLGAYHRVADWSPRQPKLQLQ